MSNNNGSEHRGLSHQTWNVLKFDLKLRLYRYVLSRLKCLNILYLNITNWEDKHPNREIMLCSSYLFSVRSECGEMHGPAFLDQGRVGSLIACVKSPKTVDFPWASRNLSWVCNQRCLQSFMQFYYNSEKKKEWTIMRAKLQPNILQPSKNDVIKDDLLT